MGRKFLIILYILIGVVFIIGIIFYMPQTYNCYQRTQESGFSGQIYGKDLDRGAVVIYVLKLDTGRGKYCLDNGYDSRYKEDLFSFIEFGDTIVCKPNSTTIEITRNGNLHYFRNN